VSPLPPAPRQWPPGTLLAALTPPDLVALMRLGTDTRHGAGEILMLEGMPSDCVHVIRSGVVKIVGEGDAVGLDEGSARGVLVVRSRGELVGEFGVLDGGPRVATVTAASPVESLRIGAAAFLRYMRDHPDASLEISRSLVRKMRLATRRRVEVKGHAGYARLARVLLELAEQYGEDGDGGRVLGFALTQAELGGIASVAPATAERLLRMLRDGGIVSTGYRRIVIHQMDALGAIADDLA
jgi:CRP/FNR family cyclic AMP-dependent transcriptional regulator